MRYAIIGLLLLLGAGLVFYLMKDDSGGERVVMTPDAGVLVPPTYQEPYLDIPDEEPDAGPPPDTGPPEPETMATTMRTPRQQECNGELTQQQILSVVGPARSQVRSCYERALKQNNVLQGTVSVAVLVERDGSVGQMRVGGSLNDNEVFSCVRRLVQEWRFPAPSNKCVQVNVPFNLTPQN